MTKELLRLKATPRTQTGKNANRKLRAQGFVPAIFYTPTGDNISVQVKEADLMKLYNKVFRTTIFHLDIEGNQSASRPCLVWDVEYYPTRNKFQHVDFYGVDLDKELRISVPLEFSGVAKGTKLGGKLEVYREKIFIKSKPGTLPSKVVVDITNLNVNEGLRVADLAMPEGVRAHYDDNYAILMVIMPGAASTEEEK